MKTRRKFDEIYVQLSQNISVTKGVSTLYLL